MIYDLARVLAQRGHEVTLFAASGSTSKGFMLSTVDVQPGSLAEINFQADQSSAVSLNSTFFDQAELFMEIFLRIAQSSAFDIVHAHAFDWPVFAFSTVSNLLTVHTVHLPNSNPAITSLLATRCHLLGMSNCVTVSQACADSYGPMVSFDRIIYNGINIDSIPFGMQPDDNLFFAGRMTPEKNPADAIRIAHKAGVRLVMAGPIYNQAYFEAVIEPLLNAHSNLVTYLGHISREQLYRQLARSKGLLFTSSWAEPFGLVIAEAQAAGTPVVAYNVGAVGEIVRSDETGFMVAPGDVDAAAAAVARISTLSRAHCREHALRSFSIQRMVECYEQYYRQKISSSR